MYKRRDLAAVMLLRTLMEDERIRLEDRLESLAGVARSVADRGELSEVAGDTAFVPGQQDGLDVREVVVQRRPADAGLLGDLRHRDRQQPPFGHQRGRGI